MFRLAHISDVHLGPLPDISYRELASKRVVGYVNWQRNRRHSMHDGIVDTIVSDIKAHAADHLTITGDLVNLALDAELEMARQWLETLGDPQDVSVVPGNHDAYVPGAFGKSCRIWQPWMTGDGEQRAVSRDTFPYLRVRGKVALIGVTSARASAPFMATGYFKSAQASRLRRLLDMTRDEGLFRIVMIHHPPVRAAVSQHKRLLGIGRFQRVIKNHGAELVIHGHSHLPSLFHIQGPRSPVPVVGVAATGQAPGGKKPAAQWNMFEIKGNQGNWALNLTRRGLTGLSTPPSEIETIDLFRTPAAMVETATEQD
ncbi:MAG: metallophosphoesterase [Rhizobiaceae bacterium]|nr:metallophosphoesterase [Rhizobiaceae bacterium]